MKEKLKAALASIQWEPVTQVRKTGDYFIERECAEEKQWTN